MHGDRPEAIRRAGRRAGRLGALPISAMRAARTPLGRDRVHRGRGGPTPTQQSNEVAGHSSMPAARVRYRVRLMAGNGEVTATGGVYPSKYRFVQGVEAACRTVGDAELADLT